MLIELGLPTVFGILKGAFNLIKRPVKYAMSSESFANNLREEVGRLENEAGRVHNLAQAARNNRRSLNDCFKEWQQSADKALEEARNLLDAFDKASKTCCYGTLPDPKCRYQFSTKAEAEIQVIRGLAESCIRYRALHDICSIDTASGNVTAPTPARRDGKDAVQSTTATASVSSASTSIKLGNDDVFESRALMIGNIMDALADDSNSVVGVYGMGGIGKSTLLVDVERKIREEKERKIREEKSFDWVAKADVSKNPDIKTIQGEIADVLGLTEIKEKETINGRAKLLHDRLKDEEREKKKVLIILDNLWEGLDLKKVGIPCRHDNKVMGCKLLLTSRHRDVLRRDMGCDKDFSLGGLKDEEAKRLFEKIVGDKVHDDELKSWVNVALDKCAGVPFLIVAMAKRFKDAELYEWRDTLKNFEEFKDKETSDLIIHMLQWSYDKLEEDVKSLLRLCVVYSISKPSLENLVRYGFGLGLFGEVSSMEVARDRLCLQIRTLQASSLLLDSEDVDDFKIHDLVREFVASVSSREHPILVFKNKDKSITELPKEKLKSCRAVCFPYVDMKELPQELDCLELQIFLLFTNNRSLKVPDSLFRSMRKLIVLNLTGVQLTCSPSTPFQFLENLHTLCLNNCSLDNVAILGELKGLQILSFVNSSIDRLPKEIGQLVELRLLDLNCCLQLKIIEPGVLRSLIKLEELYMKHSFDRWNTVDQTPPANASLIELNHMNNLRTLHVSIPHPRVLPEDLYLDKLNKYEIRIGDMWHWWGKCTGSRTLKLRSDPLGDILQKGCIQNILGKTDHLFLDKLDRNEQSICMLSKKGFSELKYLQVTDSPSVHCIHQSPSHTHFKMLESLLIENLVNLEKLCNSHIYSKSFSTLKVVRVERCDKLEVLLPLSVARRLPQLEEIKVVGCKRMQGIVDADDGGKAELHSLRVLELHNLPDIKSLFTVGKAPLSSTLHDQVGTLIAFFNEQQVAFSSLETLVINGLDNAEFLFFPSMIKSLTQLRDLEICNCKKMEAIIMEEEGSGLETSDSLQFPLLTKLNLRNLKSLMCFSHGKRSREARSQDHFKSCSIALFSREVTFPSLETLYVSGMHNIKIIWDNQVAADSFPKLKSLYVDGCNKFVTVIPSFILEWLLCLESLKVKACDSLEVVFELQPLNPLNGHHVALPLKELKISKLPKLKCVWDKELNRQVKFQCLRYVSISECKSLTSLFPTSVAKGLIQIEELKIDKCGIVELIEKEERLVPRFDFPKLTSFKLEFLTELKCIYPGRHSLHWPALETLEVCDCNKLEMFALQLENEMLLHKKPLFLIEKVTFQRLETLRINGLDNLKYMFSPSVVKSLTQLKELTISHCKKIEAIMIEEEGLGMEISEILAFPMLTSLWLSRLKGARESRNQDHIRSRATALFSQEVAFPSLKTLFIGGMDNIEMIWDNQAAVDSFPNLKSLSVYGCNNLVNIVPSSFLGRLSSLESLTTLGCDSLEVVFELQPLNPLDGHLVALPLRELRVARLPKLKHLWDKEIHRQVKFQCLRSVGVFKCKSLISLFPASVARDLIQLEELEIHECDIVELVEKEELVVCESYLEEPTSNVEAIKGPIHELKVILPFPRYIQHLKTLDVSHCDGLSGMFTPTVAGNLVVLTKLTISNCRMLTEVISDEESKEGHVVAFDHLKCIKLDGLIGLKCFSSSAYTLMFPLLEDVIVTRCPNMKIFSEGPIEASKLERVKVSTEAWFWKRNLNITIQNMFEEMGTFAGVKFMRLFEFPGLIEKWQSEFVPNKSSWQLESLIVDKCPLISYVIPFKLMLVLDNMSTLQVHDCESLEEIFNLEGLEVMESTQVLPSFRTLELVNLPKLRQLWNKDLQGSLTYNFLSYISLYNCSNLRHTLVPSMAHCLGNLQRMDIRECGQMEGVIAEEEGQGSTTGKITFPNLWWVNLECLPNLTAFLLGNNHTLECPILQKLTITYCSKMRSLTRQSLMEIDCGPPSLFTSQVQCPKLKQMGLSHMDNLSKIWSDGPQETLTFDNLWKVQVQNCGSLNNVFPHWVATTLTQLEKLQVESCGIEEIVASGNETPHSNTSQDLFPKLTSLVLHDMPQLKNFCTNLPTLNWPFLKKLRVTHCEKANTLSFVASMSNWAKKDYQQGLSDQEAHSLFQRDFPNLERLLLVDNNIQMIQDGNFPEEIFGKLKALTLACFHDEKAAFPLKFLLERFHNLQSFEVFCSSFEDIFPNERLVDNGKHPVFESLRELKLNKLPNLKSVWREGSLVSKIFQSIETFEVWDCPCLTTIFPTVTSFKNLTTLVVKNSSGLVHLVTASMVTNLSHLALMTIIGCERMKEIVTNDGDREGKVISFGKLYKLTLQNLPNLERFSSIPSCTFEFPYLRIIEVEECPKMKTFSKGRLSTPELYDVSLFRYKWEGNWEKGDDLNTTIQKLLA